MRVVDATMLLPRLGVTEVRGGRLGCVGFADAEKEGVVDGWIVCMFVCQCPLLTSSSSEAQRVDLGVGDVLLMEGKGRQGKEREGEKRKGKERQGEGCR